MAAEAALPVPLLAQAATQPNAARPAATQLGAAWPTAARPVARLLGGRTAILWRRRQWSLRWRRRRVAGRKRVGRDRIVYVRTAPDGQEARARGDEQYGRRHSSALKKKIPACGAR